MDGCGGLARYHLLGHAVAKQLDDQPLTNVEQFRARAAGDEMLRYNRVGHHVSAVGMAKIMPAHNDLHSG